MTQLTSFAVNHKNRYEPLLASMLTEQQAALRRDDAVTLLFLIEPISPDSASAALFVKNLNRLRSFLSVQTKQVCHRLSDNGCAAFLLTFSESDDYQSVLYALNIELHFISEQDNCNYYIGVSKFTDQTNATHTLTEAVECLELLYDIQARRGVCSYETLTFVRMFGILHRNEYSIVLDNKPLQLLLAYDRTNGTNYVHTLRIYLADCCNISRTADRLFIHRHTLMKRLDKIQNLCDLNLNDYYARIYMSLALLFHDYFAT